MQDLIDKAPMMLENLAQALGILVLVATFIAKLTPSPADDGKVHKISDMIHKLIGYLPTIGINPNTKKLQEAFEGMKVHQKIVERNDKND
jgi:hypothetical protein